MFSFFILRKQFPFILCLKKLNHHPRSQPFSIHLEAEGEEHGVNNIEQKSKQLQKSLSEISTLLYPLGGRFLKDDASIHCNGKGAEYLEVQVNSCLSQFLERVEHL